MYEFDIKTLWNTVLNRRKLILRNCVIGAVLALIIGFSIPKVYISHTELVAELKEDNALGGSAASLASLAGFDFASGGDAIRPDLYPNVMSSNEFLVKLLSVHVETEKGDFKGDYQTYLNKFQKVPWWEVPFAWVKSLLKDKNKDKIVPSENIDPARLTPDEDNLITNIRSLVTCSVDKIDGTISISARAQDALISKTLVDSATKHLQNFITDYRTNKARTDLAYYQEMERETKESYIKAQKDYALFCDSHRDLSMKLYTTKEQSLENDLQLAFTAYSQMKQQVQMSLAKVQENTPAFTVVKAASVPILPDSPRKKIILLGCLFLAFVSTLGWIYLKLLFFTKSTDNSEDKSAEK